jgi:hypothetical protein
MHHRIRRDSDTSAKALSLGRVIVQRVIGAPLAFFDPLAKFWIAEYW